MVRANTACDPSHRPSCAEHRPNASGCIQRPADTVPLNGRRWRATTRRATSGRSGGKADGSGHGECRSGGAGTQASDDRHRHDRKQGAARGRRDQAAQRPRDQTARDGRDQADAAEAKHDAAEAKPHETAETKAPDWESVEARIRAALAKADANRPTPPEKPAQAATAVPAPQPVDTPPTPVGSAPLNAASASTLPATTPPAGTVAALPPAAEVAPQAALQAPVLSDPPAAVEIKSRPIAAIDASASPATAASPTEPQQNGQDSAQTDPQTQVKSFFAAIKHIPDMLRTAAPAANPPRPPAPVGD